MLRTRASFAFAALTLPAFLAAQPETALWRFVQPNAKVLIGIDWARIRQSQAGAMIREKWIPQNAIRGFPALELLNSIDRFLISSSGKERSADGADATGDPGDSGDSPILIAIQGHFDAAEVRDIFQRSGAKRQAYESFQVYRPQSKQNRDMAYVLFDAETILFGDAPSVFAALDRNRFAPPLPDADSFAGAMAARAAALSAKYDIWAILDAAGFMSTDLIADLFGASEWTTAAQGLEAGLNLHSGLDADFFVHFPSEDAAKQVTSQLTRAVAQVAREQYGDEAYLARKLKFNVEGTSTRVNLHLSEQDLEKIAQVLAQSFKSGEAQAANAASGENQPAASVPTPSKPGVIRIEGLDDGPREIPYPNPQQ